MFISHVGGMITNENLIYYPVNMQDPIRKRFGYGRLWPLRPACSQNRPGLYARSEFLHPFQFRFFQNPTGSDLAGLVWVRPNTSGLEASTCAGISFWQDATGPLLVFHFQTRFRSSIDVPIGGYNTKPARIRFSSG